MAETARRSGRATKGQHRAHDEPQPATSGKKGRGRKKQETTPESEEDTIRCVCGVTQEDEDDEGREYVQCEQCKVWQHSDCMGLHQDAGSLPEEYYCEQCHPDDHKELLAEIAQGKRPWEDRIVAKRQKKGKGRRGKRGRPSAARKDEKEANGASADPEDVVMSDDGKTSQNNAPQKLQTGGHKRKYLEESHSENDGPSHDLSNKQRKPSSPTATSPPSSTNVSRRKSIGSVANLRDLDAATLQMELVSKIEDLQSEERRRAATALLKVFESQVHQAEKSGSFSLPDGQSESDFALKLTLNVEYAMFLNFYGNSPKASAEYVDKFRAISFNVKQNQSLGNRLFTGNLSPNELSKMSREDMASKELQEEKAKILKETEKQHTLIQEEGPRIRRTHKGEELVNDESHVAHATDASFNAPIRKRPSEIDTNANDNTKEGDSLHSPDTTGFTEAPNVAETGKKQSNYDIKDVLSGIKGREKEEHAKRAPIRPLDTVSHAPRQQQPDADIDRLLKDEDPDDDEPYSPVDYAADQQTDGESAVWRGRINMSNVASFAGGGRHVAGANLSNSIPWSQLLPEVLEIQGRIQTSKANEYICELKYSQSTDVVVVAVTPQDDVRERAQFDNLFEYFTARERYGVISKNLVPSVKDTYVVPLDGKSDKKPEFIELLENTINDKPAEKMLLLTFVIKIHNGPSLQQTPKPPDVGPLNSPINNGLNNSQPAPMGTHSGFQKSPPPYGAPHAGHPPSHQYPNYPGHPSQPPPAYSPTGGYAHNQSQPQQHYAATPAFGPGTVPIGRDAAIQVLGPLEQAPVVSQLLAEAPNMGVPEFIVVKQLMEISPACKTNLQTLKGMLAQRYKEQGGGTA